MGWSSIFTGRDALQGWSPELNAFAVSKLGQRPEVVYGSGEYAGDLLSGDPNAAAEWDRRYRSEIEPAFIASLSPERQAQYLAAKGDRSNTISKSNSLSKGLALGTIGAAAGGAALTGSGLLGAAAPAVPSAAAAPDMGAAIAASANGAMPGAAGAFTNPAFVSIPGAASSGGLLSSLGPVGSALGSVGSWMARNPGLVSLIGGGLAAAGSGSKPPQSSGSANFAPSPGMPVSGLQQLGGSMSPGLLSPVANRGYANSGLARFGATGGMFQPGQNKPFTWGRQ